MTDEFLNRLLDDIDKFRKEILDNDMDGQVCDSGWLLDELDKLVNIIHKEIMNNG